MEILTLHIGTVTNNKYLLRNAAILNVNGILFLAMNGDKAKPMDFNPHTDGERKCLHSVFVRQMRGYVDHHNRLQLPSDIFDKEMYDELGRDMADFLTGYFENALEAADEATRQELGYC